MAEVRIDGQAHISKIPNTHNCRTRMNKKIHKKRKKKEDQARLQTKSGLRR